MTVFLPAEDLEGSAEIQSYPSIGTTKLLDTESLGAALEPIAAPPAALLVLEEALVNLHIHLRQLRLEFNQLVARLEESDPERNPA